MCNNSRRQVSSRVLVSYVRWLGPAAPRIAAGYAQMPLPIVVEAVLAELTSARTSFTAYDVTMTLRALFPARELPHYDRHGASGVQPEVHRQMAGYMAGGAYAEQAVRPNGVDAARLYVPVRPRRGNGWLRLVPLPAAAQRSAPLPLNAWVVGGTNDEG